MLKSKLLSLCVCPALLTPPAIVAVHKPTRQATARILRKTADRLAPRVVASPAASAVELACPSVLLGTGNGFDFAGEDQPINGGRSITALYDLSSNPARGAGPGSGSGGFGGSPVGSAPGALSPSFRDGPTNPSERGPGELAIPVSGVPEPESWSLMIIGFGLVGSMIRWRAYAASRR